MPGGHAKAARALVDIAVAQGCELVAWKKHYKLRCPGGAQISLPKTPSDRRALANIKAELRRAGVDVGLSVKESRKQRRLKQCLL